jgi:anti-sigma B factor antagonist
VADLRLSTQASAMARTRLETVDFTHLRNNNVRRAAALDESEPRFSLHGDFDIANKRQLSATLEPFIDAQRLTVDLARATFIDASTLGIFLRIARRRGEINATRFRIINVSTRFRRIFSLCGLDDVVDVEDAPAWRSKPPPFVAGSLTVTALP